MVYMKINSKEIEGGTFIFPLGSVSNAYWMKMYPTSSVDYGKTVNSNKNAKHSLTLMRCPGESPTECGTINPTFAIPIQPS
jgi:hypothetical protein